MGGEPRVDVEEYEEDVVVVEVCEGTVVGVAEGIAGSCVCSLGMWRWREWLVC